MSAMKQYQIDVSQAVSQEVADVFANAARMANTELILTDWLSVRGWQFAYQGGWYALNRVDGLDLRAPRRFATWEECLAYILDQVNGFALVDDAGHVAGVDENE